MFYSKCFKTPYILYATQRITRVFCVQYNHPLHYQSRIARKSNHRLHGLHLGDWKFSATIVWNNHNFYKPLYLKYQCRQKRICSFQTYTSLRYGVDRPTASSTANPFLLEDDINNNSLFI